MGNIAIEVAYATANKQQVVKLSVPASCLLLEAVRLSGIQQLFPELILDQARLGIFGVIEKSPATRVLQAGERVEIYRPLLLDPKERRRLLAKTKAKRQNLTSSPKHQS